MDIKITIPDSAEDFGSLWESGFKISTKIFKSSGEGETIIISSNKQGLVSLARYLLFLAQSDQIVGEHNHFDDYNSLEKGSVELIIEKIE